MAPRVAEGGPPCDARDLREISDGDSIPAGVLRDFLLTCLRHDALHDAVVEKLDALAQDGDLDISGVAKLLPRMHEELLAVVRLPDWIYAAGALMDAYRDAAGVGGDPR